MAVIVPTQALLISGQVREITLGVDVAASEFMYRSGNSYLKAECGSSDVAANVACMTLEAGLNGGVISAVFPGGLIDIGAVLAAGVAYFLASTAGRMWLYGDLSVGQYAVFMGYGETTNLLKFMPVSNSVPLA